MTQRGHDGLLEVIGNLQVLVLEHAEPRLHDGEMRVAALLLRELHTTDDDLDQRRGRWDEFRWWGLRRC